MDSEGSASVELRSAEVRRYRYPSIYLRLSVDSAYTPVGPFLFSSGNIGGVSEYPLSSTPSTPTVLAPTIKVSGETKSTLDKVILNVPTISRVRSYDDAIQWLIEHMDEVGRKTLNGGY
jgi:hypothetical protein